MFHGLEVKMTMRSAHLKCHNWLLVMDSTAKSTFSQIQTAVVSDIMLTSARLRANIATGYVQVVNIARNQTCDCDCLIANELSWITNRLMDAFECYTVKCTSTVMSHYTNTRNHPSAMPYAIENGTFHKDVYVKCLMSEQTGLFLLLDCSMLIVQKVSVLWS